MAQRVMMTGTPGSGKTTLLAALAGEVEVVREAATDVVAALLAAGVTEPERDPRFLERITRLQQERARAAVGAVQLHDRSVFCTLALARFLGLAVPSVLAAALTPARDVFAPWVVHVAPLPTLTPTPVRRIGVADALRFDAVHREVYDEFGFVRVEVPVADVATRAAFVRNVLACEDSPPQESRSP